MWGIGLKKKLLLTNSQTFIIYEGFVISLAPKCEDIDNHHRYHYHVVCPMTGPQIFYSELHIEGELVFPTYFSQ